MVNKLNHLMPSKEIAIPIAAGLVIGAAAMAAYLALSTPVAASVINEDLTVTRWTVRLRRFAPATSRRGRIWTIAVSRIA